MHIPTIPKTAGRALLAVVFVSTVTCASAQTTGKLSSAVVGPAAERLTTLPQLAALAARSASELTVRWDTTVASPADPALTTSSGPFQVVSSRAVGDAGTLERAPQLSEDRLVVVAVDAAGREIGWQLVKDPGVVRAEGPTPSGVLTGQILRSGATSFVLSVPRGSGIADLRIYKPRWTGTAFALDPLGAVSVPADAR